MKSAALSTVCDINPRDNGSSRLKDNAEVSFLPMAAVGEMGKGIIEEQTRVLSEVRKGYTPFQRGDVLIAKITPCFQNGKLAIATISREVGFGTTEFHVLRPHDGHLDSRYLFHFLRRPNIHEGGIRRMTGTGGQLRVPSAFFAELSIPLPPLAEQKRIAAVLDKADDLRGKCRQALATLDTLLQSVFLDMFGEPVKLPLSWKEHAKNNPGWSECTIGDQVTLQRGKDITKSTARAGIIPVISSGGVSFFHDEAFARGPGVLLGRKGSVGNVHYVESDYWPHDTTLYVCDFKGNEPLFVYHFFLRFPIMQYEASAANPSLNRNNVHPVRVHWPSRELQRRFVGIVEQVERQKVPVARQLVEVDALFAALQSAAFAGTLFNGEMVKAAASKPAHPTPRPAAV